MAFVGKEREACLNIYVVVAVVFDVGPTHGTCPRDGIRGCRVVRLPVGVAETVVVATVSLT